MEHHLLEFILSLSPAEAADLREVAQNPRLGTRVGNFGVRRDRGKFSVVKHTSDGKRTSLGAPTEILAFYDAVCGFVNGLKSRSMDLSGAMVRTIVDASESSIAIPSTPPTTFSLSESSEVLATSRGANDAKCPATFPTAALPLAGSEFLPGGAPKTRPTAPPNGLAITSIPAETKHPVSGSTTDPTTVATTKPATVVDNDSASPAPLTRGALRVSGSTSIAKPPATSTATEPTLPDALVSPIKAFTTDPAAASTKTPLAAPAAGKDEDKGSPVGLQLPQADGINPTAKISAVSPATGPATASTKNDPDGSVTHSATSPATNATTTPAIPSPTAPATIIAAPASKATVATPASVQSLIPTSPTLAQTPPGQTEFQKASTARQIPVPSSLERAGVTITRETFYAEDGELLLRLTVDPGTTDWMDSPLTPPNFTRRIWAGKIIFEQRFPSGEHLCRGLDSTARFAVTYLSAGGDLKRIKTLPSVYAEFLELGGAL